MKRIYFDTETACWPKDANGKNIMIQLGLCISSGPGNYVFYEDKNLNDLPIASSASAAHHIVEEDLEGLPRVFETETYKVLEAEIEETELEYLIAHNISFDAEVLKLAGIDISEVKQIDTLKVMRYINDSQGLPYDSCGLTYLIYELKLYRKRKALYNEYDINPKNNHDALIDVVDLILLTEWIIEEFDTTLEEMYEISTDPLIYTYMPSGSNRGKRMDELTPGQLKWQAENSYDEDVKYTCRELLGWSHDN